MQVQEVQRSKWVSMGIYIFIDAIQIAFVSLLYLDPLNPFVVSFDLSSTDFVASASLLGFISLAQLSMIYGFAIAMRNRKDMIRLYPPSEKSASCACKYGAEEIVKWTKEVAKISHQDVSHVYLMSSPLPNAFTFALPGLGSTFVLQSNLLDLLRPEEIKTIIAHEVAHIRNRDSIISILVRMPQVFVQVVYIYIYMMLVFFTLDAVLDQRNLSLGLIRLGVLFGFLLLSRVVMELATVFIQKASRQAELLADYEAAGALGSEATMNALIVLGQRVEAMTALMQEVQWLDALNPRRPGAVSDYHMGKIIQSYPLDGIDEDNAKLMAPRLYLADKLQTLREVYGVQLSDADIERAVTPAADKLVETRRKEAEKTKPPQNLTLDWREADRNKDGRLSPAELKDLVRMLRESPRKLMFDNEVGMNILTLDHPDFRRRILFLADAFGL